MHRSLVWFKSPSISGLVAVSERKHTIIDDHTFFYLLQTRYRQTTIIYQIYQTKTVAFWADQDHILFISFETI